MQLHGIAEDYLYESAAKELLQAVDLEIIKRDDEPPLGMLVLLLESTSPNPCI